jgi:hypothetical protein
MEKAQWENGAAEWVPSLLPRETRRVVGQQRPYGNDSEYQKCNLQLHDG